MRISLTALRAFEATARHASMSMAAAELRVGLASISRHVSALQARLGVELLRREGRRVALTPAGRAYFAEITAAFRNINTATESISRDRGPRGPKLVIRSDHSLTQRWLLPRLARFSAGVPGLSLHVLGPDAGDETDGAPDIMLAWRHNSVPPAADEVLLCEPGIIAVAAGPVPAGLAPLLRGTALIHNRSRAVWRDWLSLAGHAGEVPAGGVVVPDKSMGLAAAVEGLGVALTCRIMAAADLDAGRCHQVLPQAFVLGRYVAIPGERLAADPGLTQRFIAWLGQEMDATMQATDQSGQAAA